MSFLNDILGSIGTGQARANLKPVSMPSNPRTTKPIAGNTKPVAKPAINGTVSSNNGTKRKAEEELRRDADRVSKPKPSSGLPSNAKLANPASSVSLTRLPTSAANAIAKPPNDDQQTVAVKGPAKGSFADILARAKQAQEQRGQNQVGVIKHQASSKEKVSRLAIRRQQEEERTKSQKGTSRPAKADAKPRRSASPIKRQDGLKADKTPRPPLSAPTSSYKGTMGRKSSSARPGPPVRRSSKYDDYLETDEEDDGEDAEDEVGYGTDESSDMEAGAFDIDREEQEALKKAKQDDAKELALERQLAHEKEERRKKLQALADKSR